MPKRLAILLSASAVSVAACTSSAPVGLGPTPTAISADQVERVADFGTALEVFAEQVTVSYSEVDRRAARGASGAVMDAAIRREAGRLIRVVSASIEEYGRKTEAARERCRCNIEPLNFSDWIDKRLHEVDAWVRQMETAYIESPRPRALTTLDDIYTELALLIVNLVGGDSSQRAGYLYFYLSNLRPGDPFPQPEVISRVEALPAALRIRGSLWLNEGPLWKINVPSFSALATEIESGRPEDERRLLLTFAESLIEKDYAVYNETDGVATVALHELAAQAAWGAPGLPEGQRQEIEAVGASLFIRVEAMAFASQISYLRRAGFGQSELGRVRDILLRSEYFDEQETGHAALLEVISDLDAYMAAAETARDEGSEATILEAVAHHAANYAAEFRHLPTLRNRFLNSAVERDIATGRIAARGTGRARSLEFSSESFLHAPRYAHPARPDFPDLVGILEANPQLLTNPQGAP